jgi:hypothetical protein
MHQWIPSSLLGFHFHPMPVSMPPGEWLFGEIVLGTIALFVGVTLILNTWARRHFLRWHARYFSLRLVLTAVLTLIGLILAVSCGLRSWWLQYLALMLASVICSRFLPERRLRRSRHIPAAIRRAVIDRHERNTGKQFDSATEELDHIFPFAEGGGHTHDNLRVVKKSLNRRKGKTQPTIADWWKALLGRSRTERLPDEH